jgi:hypothetical protein
MVEQADDLVSELMQELTAGFDEERSKLEAQWGAATRLRPRSSGLR